MCVALRRSALARLKMDEAPHYVIRLHGDLFCVAFQLRCFNSFRLFHTLFCSVRLLYVFIRRFDALSDNLHCK